MPEVGAGDQDEVVLEAVDQEEASVDGAREVNLPQVDGVDDQALDETLEDTAKPSADGEVLHDIETLAEDRVVAAERVNEVLEQDELRDQPENPQNESEGNPQNESVENPQIESEENAPPTLEEEEDEQEVEEDQEMEEQEEYKILETVGGEEEEEGIQVLEKANPTGNNNVSHLLDDRMHFFKF